MENRSDFPDLTALPHSTITAKPMTYLYAAALSQIPDCPCGDCAPVEMESYHAVWEPLDDGRNFQPAALKNPARFLPGSPPCIAWGLSMFHSPEGLQRHLIAIFENFPNLNKLVGTHVAQGNVLETHGTACPKGKNGHFTLHPSTQLVFTQCFHIVSPILDPTP